MGRRKEYGQILTLRITDADLAVIDQAVALAGGDRSQWIRRTLLQAAAGTQSVVRVAEVTSGKAGHSPGCPCDSCTAITATTHSAVEAWTCKCGACVRARASPSIMERLKTQRTE